MNSKTLVPWWSKTQFGGEPQVSHHQRRADIDGLRAVAILPIVLFHAGVSGLRGGFTGVDVFFVISGYLITGLSVRELASHEFSLLGFYHRRIIRILPALFSMLCGVVVLGSLTMLPAELLRLTRAAAATALFSANVFLSENTGYFARSAETLPLTHTWSLGVEEQFYIFYPPLLMLLRDLKRRYLLITIFGVAAFSFVIGLILVRYEANAAFYLLPGRIWELLIGALVSLGVSPRIDSVKAKNAASLTGLLLILLGILLVRPGDKFPTPAALLPCIGAALLLAYGRQGITSVILGWSPIRWIGTISYSLYLWHWPIITFYRLEFGFRLAPIDTVVLLAASFAAATMSYLLVERPTARYGALASPRLVITAGFFIIIGVGCITTLVGNNAATLRPLPASTQRVVAFNNYVGSGEYRRQFRAGTCFIGDEEAGVTELNDRICLARSAYKPNYLLIGDSHGAHIWRSLQERYPGVNLMQATAASCRPVITGQGRDRCRRSTDRVLKDFAKRDKADLVILVAQWRRSDLTALLSTLGYLNRRGLPVVVVGPGASYERPLPELLAQSIERNDLNYAHRFLERSDIDDESLSKEVGALGARYIPLRSIECPESNRCVVVAPNGDPLLFDSNHLTPAGATFVTSKMPLLPKPRPKNGVQPPKSDE